LTGLAPGSSGYRFAAFFTGARRAAFTAFLTVLFAAFLAAFFAGACPTVFRVDFVVARGVARLAALVARARFAAFFAVFVVFFVDYVAVDLADAVGWARPARPLTTSLKAPAGPNRTPFDAAILTDAPVCGFRPIRALRRVGWAGERDTAPGFHFAHHRVEHRVDRVLRLALGQRSHLADRVDEIRLVHSTSSIDESQ